jgi:hypothetical protein
MTSEYKVVALCRDAASANWCTVIEFSGGRQGPLLQIAVSCAALHTASRRVLKELAHFGLHVGRDAAAREFFVGILLGPGHGREDMPRHPRRRVTLPASFGPREIIVLAYNRPAADGRGGRP